MRKLLLGAALLLLPFTSYAQRVVVSVPEVRVSAPPPPVRVETQPVRPSANHSWIPGYWAWRGGRHVWIGGHWGLAPGASMVWEPARWTNRDGQWVFVEGHWRHNGAPAPSVVYEPAPVQETVVAAEPPPAFEEVRPALPFAGAVWIPGYWHWNGGNHVWVAGRYSAPRQGYRWEPHHWERTPRGWRMNGGRWRRG
jgi:hypothetical protein